MKQKIGAFFLTMTISLYAQKAIVKEPIVDLRIKPVDAQDLYKRDAEQESQLLYGEHINIFEEQGDWVKVEAPFQPDFFGNNRQWGFDKGWIKKGTFVEVDEFPLVNCKVNSQWAKVVDINNNILFSLSFGTKIFAAPYRESLWRVNLVNGLSGFVNASDLELFPYTVIPDALKKVRSMIVSSARLFIGTPYRWGGCSAYSEDLNKSQRTGFDCSGLAHLLYRNEGITIPRNSKDQYEASVKLDHGRKLQEGDLIFLAREGNPEKIGHVMIYVSDDTVIDAEETLYNCVREIKVRDLFGKPLEEIASNEKLKLQIGTEEKYYTFYFGTYLKNIREAVSTL